MSLTVQALQLDQGKSVYYEEAWHLVIETHLPALRTNAQTTVLSIDPHTAYKYQGDLHGVLQVYNQPPSLYWIIMRMNGLLSPFDYKQSQLSLLVPAQQTIEQLRTVYMTISAKTN